MQAVKSGAEARALACRAAPLGRRIAARPRRATARPATGPILEFVGHEAVKAAFTVLTGLFLMSRMQLPPEVKELLQAGLEACQAMAAAAAAVEAAGAKQAAAAPDEAAAMDDEA